MRRKSDDCRNIQNKSVNEQRKRDAEKSILCLIYCLDYGFFLFFIYVELQGMKRVGVCVNRRCLLKLHKLRLG